MSLDRFVMLLMVVVVAAGATIFMIAFVFTALTFPRLSIVGLPILLIGYVIWRVVAQRLSSREDSHYDDVDP